MRTKKTFLLGFLLLPFFCLVSAYAQDRITIRGVITDAETGDPLPGVTVIEDGTTNGASADFDGNYSITVSSNAALIFTSVGYARQRILVNGRTQIDIAMTVDSQLLDEVVVVGYGVQKKSNVTGAIASVESADLQNRTSENVGQAIQGKVSGVQVLTTSGAPNSETSFRIRGYSNTGSSNPLYIVDGLQVSSINYLNPENIESIEVLKDAASAAIYGA